MIKAIGDTNLKVKQNGIIHFFYKNARTVQLVSDSAAPPSSFQREGIT